MNMFVVVVWSHGVECVNNLDNKCRHVLTLDLDDNAENIEGGVKYVSVTKNMFIWFIYKIFFKNSWFFGSKKGKRKKKKD